MARITIDNIDLLDASIGNFRYWQIKMVVLLVLVNILIASMDIGNLFMIPPFELWCNSNGTLKTSLLNNHLPCVIDKLNNTSGYVNSSILVCNRLGLHHTLLNEWSLSNQRKEFTDITRTLVIIGTALGGVLLGRVADIFGRKFSLVVFILLQTLCGIISAVINSYGGFLTFKFISGVLNAGILVSSMVLSVEVASKRFRSYLPAINQIVYGIDYIVLAGIGCCMYKWREFQLLLAAINVIFLSYFWFLSESPRWLVVNKCKDELVKMLNCASGSQSVQHQIVDEMCLVYSEVESTSSLDIIRMPLRRLTIPFCLVWCTLGILWGAIFEFVGETYNSPYTFVLVQGLVSLLGALLLSLGSRVCGRYLILTTSSYFVTLCLFGIWMIPAGDNTNLKNTILAEMGFLGLTVAVGITYVYTVEVFPTVLRCTVLGFVNIFLYIGFGVVSLIGLTGAIIWVLPIVFICLTIQHFYAMLPESKGTTLPNVLSDIREEEVED